MKRVLIIAAFLLFASPVAAQCTAQAGFVCVPQETANKLFNTVEQLIAAKDALAKLQAERGASDAVIASANQVINGLKELDAINNTIIAKQRDVIALYERVITMYQSVVEKLEKQLGKGRTPWQKFIGALKSIATLLAGVAIGRAGF